MEFALAEKLYDVVYNEICSFKNCWKC